MANLPSSGSPGIVVMSSISGDNVFIGSEGESENPIYDTKFGNREKTKGCLVGVCEIRGW